MYDFLFLTHQTDIHSIELSNKLTEKGYSCFLFNIDNFSENYRLAYSVSDHSEISFLISDGTNEVDLQKIKCVVFRAKASPKISPQVGEQFRKHMQDESITLIKWIRSALNSDVFCFPSNYHDMHKGANKLWQLKAAKEIGLAIPDSCIGNDAITVDKVFKEKSIQYFSLKTLNSNVITKKLSFIESFINFIKNLATSIIKSQKISFSEIWETEKNDLISNQKVSIEDFPIYKESLHFYPVIIQKYIEKAYELRITIINKNIFTVKLLTQENPVTIVDSRTQLAEDEADQVPCDLPPEVEEKLLLLMDKLQLDYGCIDMIVTPTDEYVFLEVNPGGNYLWVEYRSGLPITESIAQYLIDKCESVKQIRAI